MKGKASKFWKCPREAEVEATSGQSSTEMVVVQSSLWMKTANQIRMTCLPRFMRRWQGLIQNLGYGEANHGDLVSKCVKFWYTNQLGSLTVFPFQPAVKAVHGVLAGSRFAVERNCKEYLRKLAYFLPITAKRGSLKKNEEKTFGYAKARAVFRGGGPFILEDSPDLAIRALTRLGYLDQFNTDVPEAMFLFLNSAENKGSLRKFGWLPGPGDNHVDVDRNLRVAFLSDLTGGRWQIKNPARSIKAVLQILEKNKTIQAGHSANYSLEETFQAMKLYAKQHQLPVMRTLNGLAWSILRKSNAKDPTMRSVGDFDRWCLESTIHY